MHHSALFLVVVVLAVSPLATTATLFGCSGGVYTANSTYEANLRRLAAILPAETASNPSLQAFRGVGYWPNRVRASSRCYRHGGVSSSSCAACVADAFREAETACSYGKKVVIFGSNCTLSLADFPRSLLDCTNKTETACSYGKMVIVFSSNSTLSLVDFPTSLFFGPSSWFELLGAGLAFQAIGFACLFFLLLQEWRGKRRGSIMRSGSIPSGDQ